LWPVSIGLFELINLHKYLWDYLGELQKQLMTRSYIRRWYENSLTLFIFFFYCHSNYSLINFYVMISVYMNEIYIYCKKKDISSELEMLNCIFPININVHDFPFLLQFYIHFISEFTMMNCLLSISFYADQKQCNCGVCFIWWEIPSWD
jgi:hypothetical protein